MGLGKQNNRQQKLFFTRDEIPRSPGHVFYDRLQSILKQYGFDRHVQDLCEPYYASGKGRPSIPPGRYFRMHLVGYFEGIESERGIEWRCADSLSLREFLLLDSKEPVPDHSSLSRIRSRLPLELHQEVFNWVLEVLADAGLIQGNRVGVDASTMEANAAMRSIVRRDTGEGYRQMLERMAKDSGIQNPSEEDLSRMDRKRQGKKTSNQDWKAPSDPDARIAKMKDGRTRLAYKPEHAVDLDTGVVLASEIHHADKGDTKTLPDTLKSARDGLSTAGKAPISTTKTEVVADKGYHSRGVLKDLEDSSWKTRIREPKSNSFHSWNGDYKARRAVYNNRQRLKSGKGRESEKLRTELVERSNQHILDRGPMRRTWLRGRENIHKRYLLTVAAFNLSILMRKLIGAGTPKGAAEIPSGALLGIQLGSSFIFIFVVSGDDNFDSSNWFVMVFITDS
jgi:transposase